MLVEAPDRCISLHMGSFNGDPVRYVSRGSGYVHLYTRAPLMGTLEDMLIEAPDTCISLHMGSFTSEGI